MPPAPLHKAGYKPYEKNCERHARKKVQVSSANDFKSRRSAVREWAVGEAGHEVEEAGEAEGDDGKRPAFPISRLPHCANQRPGRETDYQERLHDRSDEIDEDHTDGTVRRQPG